MNHYPQLPLLPSDGEWGVRSIEVINEVLKDAFPQTSAEEIIKLVQKRYPFGERAYHPYKVWLKKVQMLKRVLNGEPIDGRKRETVKLEETPLFA